MHPLTPSAISGGVFAARLSWVAWTTVAVGGEGAGVRCGAAGAAWVPCGGGTIKEGAAVGNAGSVK